MKRPDITEARYLPLCADASECTYRVMLRSRLYGGTSLYSCQRFMKTMGVESAMSFSADLTGYKHAVTVSHC